MTCPTVQIATGTRNVKYPEMLRSSPSRGRMLKRDVTGLTWQVSVKTPLSRTLPAQPARIQTRSFDFGCGTLCANGRRGRGEQRGERRKSRRNGRLPSQGSMVHYRPSPSAQDRLLFWRTRHGDEQLQDGENFHPNTPTIFCKKTELIGRNGEAEGGANGSEWETPKRKQSKWNFDYKYLKWLI